MIVIFGADGSPQSQHAIREAARLMPLKDAELFAVAVTSLAMPPIDIGVAGMAAVSTVSQTMMLDQSDAAVHRQLDVTLGLFAELGLRVTPVERTGDPGDELLRVAQELKADLIVVGSHGHGPIARLIKGSVADRMTHHAAAAVLVVHMPGFEG